MNARHGYLYPSSKTMQELYVEFIQDLTPEQVDFMPCLMFHVEQAQWHYENNIVDKDPRFRSLSIRDFTCFFFKSFDRFRTHHANHVDEIVDEFTSLKKTIPVAGSIILDHSNKRCLLVKGWNSGSWSFPKGKWLTSNEEDPSCAIRESLEETGYDISPLLKVNDFIKYSEEGKRVVLYITKGVDENYPFQPKTKMEVGEIAWHPLSIMERRCNKYFMVRPFLGNLKNWI